MGANHDYIINSFVIQDYGFVVTMFNHSMVIGYLETNYIINVMNKVDNIIVVCLSDNKVIINYFDYIDNIIIKEHNHYS